MKPCRTIRKRLSAYQDRELGLDEKETIESHLRICEACRTEYERLLQTYRMLGSLPVIDPPPGLSRQIVDGATRQRKTVWVPSPGKAFRLITLPAAVIMLAAIGLFMGIMLGNLLTEKQFHTSSWLSASLSDQALTLTSVKVFDAAPSVSFAEDYLRLVALNPEISHEK